MRILLSHATAGAGHTKAAEAIYEQLILLPGAQITFLDSLDYTIRGNKWMYRDGYAFVITKVPWLWGFFVWFSSILFLRPVFSGIRRIFNSIIAWPFKEYLLKEQYDVIISTHFMANEVAGHLRLTGQLRSKLIGVLTDYDSHFMWTPPGVDEYAVGCDFTRDRLLERGIPAEKITITGIPIHAKFSQPLDRSALKARFGLDPKLYTVLILMGSFGSGPIESWLEELKDFQSIVICGKNKALLERLSARKDPRIMAVGFIDNMHELMEVSDCVITKAGGQSLAEAMAKDLPMILFGVIPGQEMNNVRILRHYGIGIVAENMEQVAIEIRRLSISDDERAAAHRNISRMSRPYAAKAVVDILAKIK